MSGAEPGAGEIRDVEHGHAASETTPLLVTTAVPSEFTAVGTSGDPVQAASSAPLNAVSSVTVLERIVHATAGLTAVLSVLSMILEAAIHPVIYVSGALGLILAPYAAIQQSKMFDIRSLQETNAALELEVNQLQQENAVLQDQTREMTRAAKEVQLLEKTYVELTEVQGRSIKDLQLQLEQSRAIVENLEDNTAGEVLQNLITMVLMVDNNNDKILSDEEINDLIHRLEKINGVELRERLLRRTIVNQYHRRVSGILAVAKQLLREEEALVSTTGKKSNMANSIFHFVQKKKRSQVRASPSVVPATTANA
jgi:hypothetical protein